jgi:hypothetical protein
MEGRKVKNIEGEREDERKEDRMVMDTSMYGRKEEQLKEKRVGRKDGREVTKERKVNASKGER